MHDNGTNTKMLRLVMGYQGHVMLSTTEYIEFQLESVKTTSM